MINDYYMDESVSGQNEANPVFWLANRTGKMGQSDLSHLGFPELVIQEKVLFLGDKINFLWINLVWSRWRDIDLVLLCIFIGLRNFVSVHKIAIKKKNGQYPVILASHLLNNAYKLYWSNKIL